MKRKLILTRSGNSALHEAIDDGLGNCEVAITNHLQGLATAAKTEKKVNGTTRKA